MSAMILPRLLAFPITACVGQWWWMTHYPATNWAACAFWIPLLTYSWFCIGGLSHEIVHGNLGVSGRLQRLTAFVIGTVLGIPYSVYKEVHMRHHAYLNTPFDWEMWPYGDPAVSLRFRRVFVWFDVLFAIVVTPIVWSRICFSSQSPVSPELKRRMKTEYLAIAVFWSGTIAACVWAHRTGRYLFEPQQWIYALPPVFATMLNGFRKLMDHVGTKSIDPLHGTRTVIGTSMFTKLVSYLNFDLAVHGPHHRHPKLSHDQLKQRMTEISDANPNQHYTVFPSFLSAAIDTLRTAVWHPGVGVNAGCTDDLSHLKMAQKRTSAT